LLYALDSFGVNQQIIATFSISPTDNGGLRQFHETSQLFFSGDVALTGLPGGTGSGSGSGGDSGGSGDTGGPGGAGDPGGSGGRGWRHDPGDRPASRDSRRRYRRHADGNA